MTKQFSLDPSSPISVVIPTYNRASTLARALDSVLEQTHRPREIILVDDDSQDDTSTLVRDYTSCGITYLRLKKNGGVSAARNVGISRATGTFVSFLDSDDELSPDQLERQLHIATKSDQYHLVFTSIIIREPRKSDCVHRAKTGEYSTINLYNSNSTAGGASGAMVRRQAILTAGGFNEKLPAFEDWDLWFRLSPAGKAICIDTTFTIVNDDTANRITKNISSLSKGLRYIYLKYIRPYERKHGPQLDEFYITFGDMLLAAGRKKAARISFVHSFVRKKRLRSAVSLFLTMLPANPTTYNSIISLCFHMKNLPTTVAQKIPHTLRK